MITKINKLKNFGIYKDYSWGDIDDFKKSNLIYGWNYSGKTTLSKLFQTFEFNDKNKYFINPEFEIAYQDGDTKKKVNQENLSSFPYSIKVFNSEYIKRIFIWEEPKDGIKPISFYLGDTAGEMKSKINKFSKINDNLKKLKDNKFSQIINDFENFNKQNGKFTLKAKEIRDNYLPGFFNPTTFDKSHLKKIVDSIKSELDENILIPSQRSTTQKEALSENKFEPIDESIIFSEDLDNLSKKVKSILEDTAPKSISFPELEDKPSLFDWVQKGIQLHSDSTVCKFCTETLPDNRIDNLNSFYSKKLKEIQDSISRVKVLINEERKELDLNLPDENELFEILREEYRESVKDFQTLKLKYEEQLDILENDLKLKEGSIFNSLDSTEISIFSLQKKLDKIIELIIKHNERLAGFESIKEKAKTKILQHYVAEFLLAENYNNKENDKDRAIAIITKIDEKISHNKELIIGLNAKLSDIVKGQIELNSTLEILLHRDDIKVEIIDDKFRLERLGDPAENLSEGEKSAIAFAYFLTELKSMRNHEPSKLPNTIVFIDDPVSSLDSNHIFQVRSLLKEFFKSNDFNQLFISTHNFDFFSVLLDSKLFGTIRTDTQEKKRPLYYIRRGNNGNSLIEKIPKTFSSYKSEYVALFHILKEFNENDNKENFTYLMLLPNALRRFLELYTLMKYPSALEIDKRVEQVFKISEKPAHNTKLLHWFSHQNQFEKVQQHDDKLFQLQDAVEDLIEHIKENDELHWKGLNES